MVTAEFEVYQCGNLHMDGGPDPDHLPECAVCGGNLTDAEINDLIEL